MKYILENPVAGSIGLVKYQCTIQWRNGKIIADEPPFSGGGDQGPDPHSLLASAVASCALITMRMYIDPERLEHTTASGQCQYVSRKNK